MDDPETNRNLLFGIMACRNGFVSRDALLGAMHDWVSRKATPLGTIFVGRGDLAPARRKLLEQLVDEHVRAHAGDPSRSLASLSTTEGMADELAQIPDPGFQASLGHLRTRIPADPIGPSPQALASGDVFPTRVPDDFACAQPQLQGTQPSLSGRFRIVRPHARGGLGIVSVAIDDELDREVAFKEIQERYADTASGRARFVLEAEITGKLEHPGIVPIYGLGHDAIGRPYYAMRFIRGDSLADAIDRYHDPDGPYREPTSRSLQLRELLGRYLDVCDAMAYAHSRGVLHRDLKPGNIMLGPFGETLVVDWGLALPMERVPEGMESAHGPVRTSRTDKASLPSEVGAVVGTPQYMPPEQAEGAIDRLGPRSDVYGLGAILYDLLTGQYPIQGSSTPDVLKAASEGRIRRPRQIRPDVPPALEAVCLKAMALRPEGRYATPRALAADIKSWLADEPVSAYREPLSQRARRWARQHRVLVTSVAASLLVGAIGLGAVALVQTRARTDLTNANLILKQQRELADRNAKLAIENERRAVSSEAEAIRRGESLASALLHSRRQSYASDMNLAAREFEAGNRPRSRAILDKYAPDKEGREELVGVEWAYLDRMQARGSTPLEGHSDLVHDAQYQPKGRLIASISADKTVRFWDATSGGLQFSLNLGEAGFSMDFGPDGKRLITGGPHGAMVWDVDLRKSIFKLDPGIETVSAVAFSPDGKSIATGGNDGRIKLWSAGTGKADGEPFDLGEFVHDVAFSPDSRELAACGGKIARVFNVGVAGPRLEIKGHSSFVNSIAWSPIGRRIATASHDKSARIWDADNGQGVATLVGHQADVHDVAFSLDGARLATAGGDRTLRIWDASTGAALESFSDHDDDVASVAFSPDGKYLLTSSFDKTIRVRRLQGNLGAIDFEVAGERASHSVYRPDGEQVATASGNEIQLWKPRDGKSVRSLKGHEAAISDVDYRHDGRRLVSAAWDGTARIWDVETGQCVLVLVEGKSVVKRARFSPDGRRVVTACSDGRSNIWDADTGGLVVELRGHQRSVSDIAYSPDGSRIATVAADGTLRFWDPSSGREISRIEMPYPFLFSVDFSPDSRLVAVGDGEGRIGIWETGSLKVVMKLEGHSAKVVSLEFDPKGRRLLSVGEDRTVRVWETAEGSELLMIKTGEVSEYQARLSPDGNWILTNGRDRTVRIR